MRQKTWAEKVAPTRLTQSGWEYKMRQYIDRGTAPTPELCMAEMLPLARRGELPKHGQWGSAGKGDMHTNWDFNNQVLQWESSGILQQSDWYRKRVVYLWLSWKFFQKGEGAS